MRFNWYDLVPVGFFLLGFANGLWLFRERTARVIAQRNAATARHTSTRLALVLARRERDEAVADRDMVLRYQIQAFATEPASDLDRSMAVHPAGKKLRPVQVAR